MERFLFLSDIDGTLLRGGMDIPAPVLAAAAAYRAAGGLLAVCTGRSLRSALPVARTLEVNAPCILFSGTALYDAAEERYLWTRPLPAGALACVEQVLSRRPDTAVQVFTRDEIYVLRRNRRLDQRGIAAENQGPLRALSQVRGEILKLLFVDEDPDALEGLRPLFPSDAFQFAFASRHFAEVVAAGAGKHAAMARLSERLDIPFSRFFAAGDGMTDLEMMRLSGVSYAPENALDPVRRAASRVVPPVEEGGMEAAFRHAANLICEVS